MGTTTLSPLPPEGDFQPGFCTNSNPVLFSPFQDGVGYRLVPGAFDPSRALLLEALGNLTEL
jgi:hypothetical protein